jgi:hypothetical protein
MKSVRKCKVCGCTQNNACPGGCYWVEDDLCSACNTILIKKSVITFNSKDKKTFKEEAKVIAEGFENLDVARGFINGIGFAKDMNSFDDNEPLSYPVDVEEYSVYDAGNLKGSINIFKETII